MKIRLLTTYFVFVTLVVLKSQVPANLIGSNAFDLKWNQINTDQIRVIFPQEVDSLAQRVANIIHYLWDKEDLSLGVSNHKVSIILNTEATISNGLVTVGPFRSEFFPLQRQLGNATDYIDLLTIHEYRHIRQFANGTKGITKTAKNILGSWAWGGLMSLALPRWYFEGDAVISETDFTESGRGRLPSFNMQYHALFQEDIIYNYEKAGAGSLHDYVPSWYPLGYHILSYGRREYGDDLWANVMEDAVRYKGLFYPFSRSLKSRTGLSSSQMYDVAFDELKLNYKSHIESLSLSQFNYIGKKKSKYVTDFTMPHVYKDDTLLVRASYDDLRSLVKIDHDNQETKITEIGRQIEGAFSTISLGGDMICWVELANDVRRRYKQYNDIYTYHIPSHTKKRLTRGRRYAAPTVSDDGKQIAAIIANDNLSQSIHIISSSDGSLIHNFDVHRFSQISHPCWLNKDNLVLVVTKNELAHLAILTLSTGEWLSITPQTNDQLSNPFYHDGYVYYASSYSGINNIYRVLLNTGKIEKITEVAVGAFHPFVTTDGKWLLYTELESNGMKTKRMAIDSSDLIIYNQIDETHDKKYFQHNHERKSILTDLPDSSFTISNFNKWNGILKPHSILGEFDHTTASVRLLTDNVFGTLSGEAGGSYNYNEDQWTYFIGFNYAELFPIINVSYVHANRSAQFFNFRSLTDTSSVFTAFNQSWAEDRLSTGLSVPLNLSKSNLDAGLNIGANYQYSKLSLESNFDSQENFRDTIASVREVIEAYDRPINGAKISTLDIRFSAFALRRQARLSLQPKYGGVFSFRLRKQLLDNLSGGDVININGALYLPGLASTHSFFITAAYQNEGVLDSYRYGDIFNYPRGYNLSYRRDQFYKVGFNYSFPLWYPDVAIGPLAFVKRVKANLFYDYGSISFNTAPFITSANSLQSFGVEVGFDFRAFRLVEVDLGLRFSYLINPSFSANGQRHQFDFFVVSITQ